MATAPAPLAINDALVPGRPRRVVVAGGSGLIGRALVASLVHEGVAVDVLSRNPDARAGRVPAAAKAMTEFANSIESFQVKGGLLGDRIIDAAGVKMLADLPPRPVVLAGLVGALQGPMSQLVSVLQAPLREIAQVLKARSEQAPAAA